MLTLKRTYESPPVGPWSDYDYDVFDGDQRVGRIMLAQQMPEGRPWFWMTARVLQSMDDHGYAASREHAMADFEARWEALHPRQISNSSPTVDLTRKGQRIGDKGTPNPRNQPLSNPEAVNAPPAWRPRSSVAVERNVNLRTV